MEKRVVVTMLVMMGFFMAVSYIYPLIFPPPPKPSSSVTDVSRTPSVGVMTGEQVPTQGTVSPPREGGLENGVPSDSVEASEEGAVNVVEYKDVTVDTPLYIAVITEEGGRLKSFKLKNYKTYKTNPDAPDTLQELVNIPQSDQSTEYPFNLVYSQQGSVPEDLKGIKFKASEYSVTLNDSVNEGSLTLTAETKSGLTIQRTLSFSSSNYAILQEVSLTNNGKGSYDGRLGMILSVWPYSSQQNRYNVMAAYMNKSLFTETVDDAKDELNGIGLLNSASFLGYMDQYFLSAFLYNGETGDMVPMNRNLALLRLSADEIKGNGVKLGSHWPLKLLPGDTLRYNFDTYYGPKDTVSLRAVGHDLTRSVDLGWFAFIARPLGWLLRFFYGFVGNYGVAIILVTILIKIVLWPLTAKSYRSMKGMQKLSPQIQKIREKYKEDPQTMNKEMMQLYKTFNVSPLGGCLPMILQIPFFFAFYRVLDYALELRGAPFTLWITDLSAPDRLFHFNVSIPLLSQPTGIPVLTLLMGATMIWQQKLTPTMGDPLQAKIMMLLPLIFIVALLNMPSGLVLYWLVNNILSIFQQKLINRPEKDAAPVKSYSKGKK
jgi:YidC/Oxa1 family membrane protein insertase